jgi:prevent-host-death family protein
VKFYNISEFKAKATSIIAEIEKSEEEIVITKNGKPTVLVRLVEEGEFKLVPQQGKKKANGKTKRNI